MHTEEDEHWEQEEEEDQTLTVTRPKYWVTGVKSFFQRHWQPKELIEPEVDPDLHRLTGVERSAEVIRYCLVSLEHWLASSGWLREWIRLNLRIALFVAAPSLLVIPLITLALGQLNSWSTIIAQASTNMLYFPLTALLFVGLIAVLVMLTNALRRRDPRDMHRYY